jgi:hypothetical protein
VASGKVFSVTECFVYLLQYRSCFPAFIRDGMTSKFQLCLSSVFAESHTATCAILVYSQAPMCFDISHSTTHTCGRTANITDTTSQKTPSVTFFHFYMGLGKQLARLFIKPSPYNRQRSSGHVSVYLKYTEF